MNLEHWLPVVGWEGRYEVSDIGRVRSLDRTVVFADGRVRFYAGQLLKPRPDANGYLLVGLSRGRLDKHKRMVHLLVARAFRGSTPNGQEVRHLDGHSGNPALTNLEFGTRSQNHQDKRRHGTALIGDRHKWTVLPQDKVHAVLADTAGGSVSDMAERHGISRTHIWNIRNGKRRPDVTGVFA